MTLELKKFDLRSISFKPNENKGPVIVLIGRRDTGKSFLVEIYYLSYRIFLSELLYQGQKPGMDFIVTHVPKLFIHDEYNTAIIENILKRQKTVIKQIKKKKKHIKSKYMILEHL